MKTSHYALYQLQPNAHGVIVDQHGVPFDRDAYSRFKYGWLPPASLVRLTLPPLESEIPIFGSPESRF